MAERTEAERLAVATDQRRGAGVISDQTVKNLFSFGCPAAMARGKTLSLSHHSRVGESSTSNLGMHG